MNTKGGVGRPGGRGVLGSRRKGARKGRLQISEEKKGIIVRGKRELCGKNKGETNVASAGDKLDFS